ncbi:hypothetical protein EX30DRAFT_73160 [Ascodesmis nigricans]|uniref:Uncharacterized protein n=1 Tax=Ascodesmis nigricans TaxID=341454 RepID=A0A4V3SIE1_9PEZI|nr:hypothetical protein EX30DRAFT_73160 [Ascodesmis nigricans]
MIIITIICQFSFFFFFVSYHLMFRFIAVLYFIPDPDSGVISLSFSCFFACTTTLLWKLITINSVSSTQFSLSLSISPLTTPLSVLSSGGGGYRGFADPARGPVSSALALVVHRDSRCIGTAALGYHYW